MPSPFVLLDALAIPFSLIPGVARYAISIEVPTQLDYAFYEWYYRFRINRLSLVSAPFYALGNEVPYLDSVRAGLPGNGNLGLKMTPNCDQGATEFYGSL